MTRSWRCTRRESLVLGERAGCQSYYWPNWHDHELTTNPKEDWLVCNCSEALTLQAATLLADCASAPTVERNSLSASITSISACRQFSVPHCIATTAVSRYYPPKSYPMQIGLEAALQLELGRNKSSGVNVILPSM